MGLRLLLGASLWFVSSCAFFSRQPALPRRAAIGPTGSGEKYAALVDSADIIYFPSESVTFDSRSEAAWKLLNAMRRAAAPFALAWDLSADNIKSRALLAEAGRSGAEILSLRAPVAANAEETFRGFEPPADDFERFARRFSDREFNEARVRGAYESALLAEEFAAAKISSHFREHRGEKIVVFLRREHLGRDHGVPYFVSQKTKARQLILNPQRRRDRGPGLLTRN